VDEISRILELGLKNGVSKLEYMELKVEYFARDSLPQNSPLASYPISVENGLTEEQHHEQLKKVIEEEELRVREQQLEQLLITDPFKYEELVRQGELEDARDTSADDGDEE
jgi:hypothetical protein